MGGGVGYYPYFLQVSRGLIAGHKRVFKFGYNGDIDDSEETIWDVGGLYAYPASAVTMTATSSSGATDEDVEVTIQGVDASYNELSETVTLDALGTATTGELGAETIGTARITFDSTSCTSQATRFAGGHQSIAWIDR